MGGNLSNITNVQQGFYNNILQKDQQNCIAQTNQSSSGNVVIVSGATINGDVGVQTTTNTDATCLMVSNMEDSIGNQLAAITQQTNTAATDLFGDFQYTEETNIFNVDQSVTNNIAQINEATCAASSITSANNNYIYVSDTTVNGFVGVNSASNASANCSMTNMMKNTTYNQAQASATQGNTVVGMFAAFFAVLGGIIGLIIIITIIMYSTGAFKKVGYTQGQGQQQTQETPEEKALREAQDLGLTPDILQAALGQ